MRIKKSVLVMMLISLLLISSAIASINLFTPRSPPNLFQSTNSTIIFNVTMNSTNINLTNNITGWFFVTQLDNDSSQIMNSSMLRCINNTVCNVTINGFLPGFYLWRVQGEDKDGNVSSESFWFEILAAENNTLLRWTNNTGTAIATLDKFLGNFWVLGNVTGSRFNGSLNTGTIIITDDIDDNHIEGDLNTYVDVAGDVMTGNLNSTGNVTLNTSNGQGYFQGNGSYLTDVCFQNGTNCNDVFAWSSLNNASPFLATQIVFGSNTAEATYANSFLWNGTHYQTPVVGSYVITITANINSSDVTEFVLSLDVDGLSLRNVSLTHSVVNAVTGHTFRYIGCIQRGDNISASIDNVGAGGISWDNSSSISIERKSERCY